ncbi:MAG: GGDEF domain-containing protein [Myxococcota bacterium]
MSERRPEHTAPVPEDQWEQSRTEPVSIHPIDGAVTGLTPCLIVLTAPQLGQTQPLGLGTLDIGRDRSAALSIREGSISRLHARVFRDTGGAIHLEDLNSTNGTFVNGHRVRSCKLLPGDRIQLGRKTVLKLDFIGELEGVFHNQLYEAGTRDALTGLFNRRYFDQHLDTEFHLARRHGEPLTLVMMDLDYFKRVNDTYGHLAGDMVLRAFATMALKRCRREDIVARYGGEEFVLLLPRTTEKGAVVVAESLRQALEDTTLTYHGESFNVTVSAGCATQAERRFSDGIALLRAADQALYRAKSLGRNRLETTR